MRAWVVSLILLAGTATAQTATTAPKVWAWMWSAPDGMSIVNFQWRRADVAQCADCGWATIQGWDGALAPKYYGLIYWNGPIQVRVIVNDGAGELASEASNIVDQPTCATLDTNGNGVIDIVDFGQLKARFGDTCQ